MSKQTRRRPRWPLALATGVGLAVAGTAAARSAVTGATAPIGPIDSARYSRPTPAAPASPPVAPSSQSPAAASPVMNVVLSSRRPSPKTCDQRSTATARARLAAMPPRKSPTP